NKIDELVAGKWKRMKIAPSDVCSDAEFIRRITLDLTGLPPTADDVRKFMADTRDPKVKREEVVDRLVGSKEYVEYWSNQWADRLQLQQVPRPPVRAVDAGPVLLAGRFLRADQPQEGPGGGRPDDRRLGGRGRPPHLRRGGGPG